jgi:dihydropteroate synthase
LDFTIEGPLSKPMRIGRAPCYNDVQNVGLPMKTDSVKPLGITRCGNMEFRWGQRTYVMGIVNVDPDSFSGDGLRDAESAVAQGKRFAAEGADIIDVGGESTRPGFEPVSADQEMKRVLPVIERLAGELSVPVSIDTYKSEVARQAVAIGARMINDVWELKRDPKLARVAAEAGVPLIISQNQRDSKFHDFFPELIASLKKSIQVALDAGVDWNNIIIDPGVGFGKTVEQNVEIVRRLAELKMLGRPILLGTSRKSFIGHVLDLPVDQRLEGTAATVAIGIAHGADIVRVHDVAQMVRVVKMSDAIVRGRHS